MSRSKHRSYNKRIIISENDLVQIDTSQDLPYMKYVELTNYKPQHFGLDTWKPFFKIPDNWMKKIYKNEVYRDTDLPEPEVERLSDSQRRCLRDWLEQSEQYQKVEGRSTRRGLRTRPPKDDLKRCLGGSYDDRDDIEVIDIDIDPNEQVSATKGVPCDTNRTPPLSESRSSNIAILRHKYQAEEVVVEMALEKMKHLSPGDEKRYRDLLKDEDFMQFLNSQAEKYSKEDPT